MQVPTLGILYQASKKHLLWSLKRMCEYFPNKLNKAQLHYLAKSLPKEAKFLWDDIQHGIIVSYIGK